MAYDFTSFECMACSEEGELLNASSSGGVSSLEQFPLDVSAGEVIPNSNTARLVARMKYVWRHDLNTVEQ